MSYPAHGANAEALYKSLYIEMPENVIDLSENVNAVAQPKEVQQLWPTLLCSLGKYPNEQAEPFRSKIAEYHQLAPNYIAVGNGATECLMVLARYFQRKTAIVVEPSFSEYKRTLQQESVTVQSILVDDIETYAIPVARVKQAMEQADVLYICNPNNPTGVLTKRAVMEELLQYGQQVDCAIVVDEAFIDWTDEVQSVVPLVSTYDNLIVLRSMTKMYALAGVRLGYIISQQARKFAEAFPHWNVSEIAIQLGCACIAAHDFVAKSRESSDTMRESVKTFLKAHHCRVSNSAANFLLFSLPEQLDAESFFMAMLEQGIVLRHTKNYVGLEGQWFRIGMKQTDAMERFKRAFTEYVQNY